MSTISTARRVLLGLGGVAALTIAACGSESGSAQSGGQDDQGGSAAGGVVMTKDMPDVGTVLVDKQGKTVYFTDTDSPDSIKCTADCLELWVPVMADSETPQGPVADLGAVKRPDDGKMQLTYQGKPLYTFTLDSSDKPVSGHNATDSFGGVEFTWHAVVINGSGQPQQPNPGGGGYDSDGGGGGY